jgi:hypothetical protein
VAAARVAAAARLTGLYWRHLAGVNAGLLLWVAALACQRWGR